MGIVRHEQNILEYRWDQDSYTERMESVTGYSIGDRNEEKGKKF